jgi:tetratricopeptide (TPR) repeat protein
MFSKIAETVSLLRVTNAYGIIYFQMEKKKNDKIPAQIENLKKFFRTSSSASARQYAGLYLAEGLLAMGKINEAFETLVNTIQIKEAPMDAMIDDLLWMNLTNCIALNPSMSLQDIERFAPSIESFLEAIQEPMRKCEAYGSMARAFVFRDDFEQAQSYWKSAIHTGKAQDEGARKWIMMSEEQAQKWKEFKENFEARQSMSMSRPRMQGSRTFMS